MFDNLFACSCELLVKMTVVPVELGRRALGSDMLYNAADLY